MPEIRQNAATKEWVIIATERAQRPEDYHEPDRPRTDTRPAHVADCPFCPGNEALTDAARLQVPGPDGRWRLRIVANKFPALRPNGLNARAGDPIFRRMDGYGHHEVVIEGRAHNSTTALMTVYEVAGTLAAARDRARVLAADERIRQIMFFKNHGPSAGTSLEHPHCQLIALPIVPYHIRSRLEEAMRHYDEVGTCVYCEMWRREAKDTARVLAENDHFVAVIPFAALSPFHIWILPKAHRPLFLQVQEAELMGLAEVLRTVLRQLYFGLGDPDFNFVLRMAPVSYDRCDWFHWYLSIVPKVTKLAGFELGSGMYINTTLPEESARFLRSVQV